jgi:hypothetical protein
MLDAYTEASLTATSIIIIVIISTTPYLVHIRHTGYPAYPSVCEMKQQVFIQFVTDPTASHSAYHYHAYKRQHHTAAQQQPLPRTHCCAS